jgi:hypothetical protein
MVRAGLAARNALCSKHRSEGESAAVVGDVGQLNAVNFGIVPNGVRTGNGVFASRCDR